MGIALLTKMFDKSGTPSSTLNSSSGKAIGVNGIVLFKQNNPSPIKKAPAYNNLYIEFYKDETNSTPDATITLNSDYYYVANNLGFHPAKTLVKNGTTVIETVKNKIQDLEGDIKKIEIRQKIVIDSINNKTECTAMKIFQREKNHRKTVFIWHSSKPNGK